MLIRYVGMKKTCGLGSLSNSCRESDIYYSQPLGLKDWEFLNYSCGSGGKKRRMDSERKPKLQRTCTNIPTTKHRKVKSTEGNSAGVDGRAAATAESGDDDGKDVKSGLGVEC